jgi:hypothetical protein
MLGMVPNEDALERFIVENNVANFFQRLAGEQDAGKCVIVSQILLEETNRYGRLAGTLDKLEVYICQCDVQIEKYRALIEGADDADRQQALRTFVQIMREIRNRLQSLHAPHGQRLDRPGGP